MPVVSVEIVADVDALLEADDLGPEFETGEAADAGLDLLKPLILLVVQPCRSKSSSLLSSLTLCTSTSIISSTSSGFLLALSTLL